MIKWLYNNLVNKWTPTCNCGWNMKHYKDSMFITEYICIWKKCGWGAFETANGKLHWWKNSENNA